MKQLALVNSRTLNLVITYPRSFILMSKQSSSIYQIAVTQTKNNLFIVLVHYTNGMVQVLKQNSFRASCKSFKGVTNPDKLKIFCHEVLKFIEDTPLYITDVLFINCTEVTWPLVKIFSDSGINPAFIRHRSRVAHNGCKKKKKRHDI